MPYSLPPRMPSGPRRRTLLASAAGTALLTGCSGGTEGPGTTGGSPSAAARARARAARDSDGLVARYDAVIAAHPGLAERLRPLRDAAVRHAEAFGGVVTTSPAPASPTPAATGPGSRNVSSTVPDTERAALAELAATEQALADRRAEALLGVPGELARLLASVAAAGAAHAYLLTKGEGKA
ncbi:hypothetical protein ACIHCM_36365 [Streptomyces sp. NPDC052023]|uniref:hypothetical protein n=1 Tax=Streptomyces sp. NPDC052023 TaxID=3365681 RepID=UPI0037D280B9